MKRSSGTAKLSLIQQMIADENERHAYRIKEIAGMTARLKLLEPVLEALKERCAFNCDTHSIRPLFNREIKVSGWLVYVPVRVHETLLEIGFEETSRHDYQSTYTVRLKKGRLRIAVSVDLHYTSRLS
ncbi:hypothetical protein [Pandoraea terrigena]|uniref:Uncharacterized protein n=1 Tax=Pandoraea terrigena TaxID=2508292 RepID=A0A5E4YE50_9BURK|nr:hypothetical protein [Pandoraea terrigena]VVE46707.1 hypothetical protein PTE31013_04477 [Pandoraea terrigena]